MLVEYLAPASDVFVPIRVALFRVVFYLLFAVDALNVAIGTIHGTGAARATTLPSAVVQVLPSFVFTPTFFAALLVASSLGSLATVFDARGGGPGRFVAPSVSAACFSAYYALNALDRYQHHYFLCIVTTINVFALDVAPKSEARFRGAAQRALALSVAILYFFTTITKVVDGGAFASGSIIARIIVSSSDIDALTEYFPVSPALIFQLAALGAIAAESLIAISWLATPHRNAAVAFLVALVLHGGIESISTMKIGFFSYYAIALHILLIPDVPVRVPRSADAKRA